MIVAPGEYVATLPSDPERMSEAQEWLKGADGTLLDWGFGESGVDVKFRTNKPAEWPPGLPPPKLIVTGALVHQPAKVSKPSKQKKKKRAKKEENNLGAMLLLWLLTKGS